MVYDNITFGPSDDDDHEQQSKEASMQMGNRQIRADGISIAESDSDDDESPEYTYGCVRRITVDGDTNPCPGNVQTTKDYGDRFYRECPACQVEHPMEKVSIKNDDDS